MSRTRLVLGASLAAVLGCSSCATIVGTVAGPVTGPLHLEENAVLPPWFLPIAYPLSVPFGVLAGFATGAAADVGYVAGGFRYGTPGHPEFAAVWNPMSPAWPPYEPDMRYDTAPKVADRVAARLESGAEPQDPPGSGQEQATR